MDKLNSFSLEQTQGGHKHRLQERFLKEGLDHFQPYEVLELLLSYSLTRQDTKELAKQLLHRFGNLNSLLSMTTEELCKVKGISRHTAFLLQFFKAAHTFLLRETIIKQDYISSLQDVLTYLQAKYKGVRYEEFRVLYLNTRNIILYDEKIADGTINEARVYIRKIVERAFQYGCSGLILVHNHPSGSTQPSQEDIQLTKRIQLVAPYLDLRILDHLIIAQGSYYSFAEQQIL